MTRIAVQPEDVALRRRRQLMRLSLVQIPALRAVGFFFLSIGVFLNNRYFLHQESLTPWLRSTAVMALYAALSWLVLVAAWKKANRDLTLAFLIADLVIWSYAIYVSGAEQSLLFFILLLRVADQTQTTFRRCLGFVALGSICFSATVAWSSLIGHHPVDVDGAAAKLVFISVGGIYIAMSARTAEMRRQQVRDAMHISRDLIQQLEQSSEDLSEARRRAEEANAAKSEFLANMSHEMRTPLHGVIGMLQLARDGEMSADRARHIELAQHSAESLLGTIDDVLEFSRIEARKLELEPVYFSLRDLMNETMKPLGVTAAAKGLVLSCSIDHDVPDSLWTDPLRLRQIVTNLAGNAIKFTQAGEVSVRIRSEQGEGNRLMLLGEVEDTGIGIDPAVQRLIFEPFTQVDSSRTRRYSGTGLGLAIVARLVEAMGGTIDVESRPAGGSRFTFSIGAEADRFSVRDVPEWESALRGRRVLIVDHHERERTAIGEMLRGHGMMVAVAAWFDEAPSTQFDCLVATENPRRHPAMVTIRSPLDRDTSASGVSRPVGERELLQAIASALGVLAPEPLRIVQRPPHPAAKPLRILIAEDNPVAEEFAVEALQRLGHSTVVAKDGGEAVKRATNETFDAILMDVQMPGMDGLEATRAIRALDFGAKVPIFAMTAHTRPEERARCIEAGMNGVLTKPIDRRELAETLGEIAPQADPELSVVAGNPKLLARVTAAFAEQTPLLVAAIGQAISDRDGESLYRYAHKLKGSVSHFPGEALRLAEIVESSGREKKFDDAAAVMPQLEKALRDLEERLTAALASAQPVSS